MDYVEYVECILICLSCKLLLDLHLVQSESINENNCSLDHEVHFENLYTRFTLDGRRQRRQDYRVTYILALIDKMRWKCLNNVFNNPGSILNYLIPMKGPKKSPSYNPTMGYEPYWPLGDWVFSHAPNQTTKGVSNEQCGQKCPEIFQKYGLICGRDRKDRYKTFENYCVMMNEDCTQRTDWLIAYRGECWGDLRTYPTKRLSLRTRAATYISNFLASHSTTPMIDESFFDKFRTTTTKK